MNIGPAPRTHEEFRPYAHSPRFREVYQPHSKSGRLVNIYSANCTTSLHVGGQEDLASEMLERCEQNILLQIMGKPNYTFVYHSGMVYATEEAKEFGVIDDQCTLVRFDAHPDADKELLSLDRSLEKTYRPYQSKFHEGSYLWQLVVRGLVSEVLWFSAPVGPMFVNGSTEALQKAFPALKITEIPHNEITTFDFSRLDHLSPRRLLLDIDWDFAAHINPSYMPAATKAMQYVFRRAGLVFQALSPDYIRLTDSIRLTRDFPMVVAPDA